MARPFFGVRSQSNGCCPQSLLRHPQQTLATLCQHQQTSACSGCGSLDHQTYGGLALDPYEQQQYLIQQLLLQQQSGLYSACLCDAYVPSVDGLIAIQQHHGCSSPNCRYLDQGYQALCQTNLVSRYGLESSLNSRLSHSAVLQPSLGLESSTGFGLGVGLGPGLDTGNLLGRRNQSRRLGLGGLHRSGMSGISLQGLGGQRFPGGAGGLGGLGYTNRSPYPHGWR